jgi:protein TonB
VDELVANVNLDESVFSPPAQSIAADWCANPEPPKALEKPGPSYPESAKAKGQQGVVSVYGVVGADGAVHGLTVVRSAGRDFDSATLAAVARWKYRPAMCGGNPTPIEKLIDVTYALQP